MIYFFIPFVIIYLLTSIIDIPKNLSLKAK